MPPPIAALAVIGLMLTLYTLNHRKKPSVSTALWLPIAWFIISASRFVSQWLGEVGATSAAEAQSLVEGNSLDANIFLALLFAGILVLCTRRRRVAAMAKENVVLLSFLAFCLLSASWSDFPIVALKRWVKALGDVVMVAIVLTDEEPVAALRRIFVRQGFLLVPLSILFIRYYPMLGRQYSSFSGEAYNVGVATGKNGLGFVCLVFGIGSLWCFLDGLSVRGNWRTKLPLVAHGVFLVLVLWTFQMAHSATAFSCFALGGVVLMATRIRIVEKNTIIIHAIVAGLLFLVVYALLLDPGAGLTQVVGRDATLTGRTVLWSQALSLTVNPLLGAGYESFWLGERLEAMWKLNWEKPNQAHNGYLEIYLDLGWVGICLVGLVMARGYLGAIRTFRLEPEMGRVRLAFFVIAAVYNLTEHAFRELHPVWILFLFAVTTLPVVEEKPAPAGIVWRREAA